MTGIGEFHGAKLLLVQDNLLLTCLRDDIPEIPFPDHWNLPGGGREGEETPVKCALRELREEFGLRLPKYRLTGYRFPSVQYPGSSSWFFHGELTSADIKAIRFGKEGQEWQMMPVAEFLNHPKAVPHFKPRITAVLSAPKPKAHHP